MPSGLKLVDRDASSVLFRSAAGPVGPGAFLAAAARLAACLPDRPFVNACADRLLAAVGIAASLLRGQVSLIPGEPGAATIAALAARHPGAHLLFDGEGPAPGTLPATRVSLPAGMDEAASGIPALPADLPAMIVFTSGTTGTPVGTTKSWGELVARSRAAAARFGLGGATVVATVPAGHMYGLETSVLLPLHAPVTVRCGTPLYPADVAAALADAGPGTVLVTTPLQLRAALRGARPGPAPSRVISATAPLDPALAAEAEAVWGTQVFEILGATEVGSIASRRTVAGPAWRLYDGLAFRDDAEGVLVEAPHAAPRRFGDLVRRDPDGRHFELVGRPQDLVKLGGRRASLAGLAHAVCGIGGVEDAVFVAPADLAREPASRLAALVVAPGHDAASLADAMRRIIDPVFLPRPLVLLDRLPRNALGKLPRADLLAILDRHLAARAPAREGAR